MPFILGKKLKMTQVWQEGEHKQTGKENKITATRFTKVVPVTPVLAAPNKVSMVRTKAKDGYEAVQVSMGKNRKEFRNRASHAVDVAQFKAGGTVTVASFKEGDKVTVSGFMKGRGFAGVVKRYNFAGGPKTHGQKNRHRAPGSIGSTAFQRVVKGRRMAGHMGTTRVTVRNLVVAGVDPKKNILFLRGAVPGAVGGVVEIRK
ncbi:MAG TPA: 50S ribosomal protein L3 [Candidatus Paceibacterota bacterium]|nr:50S ribosomal protein L3 [Candidatus Paceibacterota bacterium]